MKDISDGQMYWIIKNGSKGTGMMAYSGMQNTHIWQLIHYRHIKYHFVNILFNFYEFKYGGIASLQVQLAIFNQNLSFTTTIQTGYFIFLRVGILIRFINIC